MYKVSRSFFLSLVLIFFCISFAASAQIDVEFDEDKRHHLSVVTAGTTIFKADETAFTLGIDYEYRLNRLVGVGLVLEQAFGDVDATSLLAVADLHIWKGLALQIGPGLEFIDETTLSGERENETNFIFRLGTLYEFEFDEKYTLSPQVHYDASSGEDALVFGLALGIAF